MKKYRLRGKVLPEKTSFMVFADNDKKNLPNGSKNDLLYPDKAINILQPTHQTGKWCINIFNQLFL